ncbi:MAG: hypothetical protein H6842_10285 [Rhodospirillaceae bacterium]|nr:hypothetical protein [Rhodospirillaceae bacterium]
MTRAPDLLAELFFAGDGEIVGRIRLQKIAYLLQQKAGRRDLFFTYHHYGPYSRELAEALDRAVILEEIDEKSRDTDYGTTYSIFHWKKRVRREKEAVGPISMTEAKPIMARLKKEPAVILELAATIHWLIHKEQAKDWESELKIRKKLKSTPENIGRAKTVLRDLGLDQGLAA